MKQNPQPNGLDELRGDGRMTWSEAEQGWFAAPEEIVHAFSSDGFTECKREVTTSRRDSQRAGGVWQGINTRTGAVASTIWVNRLLWPQAVVFITVDGESLRGDTFESGLIRTARTAMRREPWWRSPEALELRIQRGRGPRGAMRAKCTNDVGER